MPSVFDHRPETAGISAIGARIRARSPSIINSTRSAERICTMAFPCLYLKSLATPPMNCFKKIATQPTLGITNTNSPSS